MATFNHLLTDKLINLSKPVTALEEDELLKQAAAEMALGFFMVGKVDLPLGHNITFSSVFSQERYGPGATVAMAGICAYACCLKTHTPSPAFMDHIQVLLSDVIRAIRMEAPLTFARKALTNLNNFGGYYEPIFLSRTPKQKLFCPVKIDVKTGHLVAELSNGLADHLFDLYYDEMVDYLTPSGQTTSRLPDNIGNVIIAYADELSKTRMEAAFESTIVLDLCQAYIVPVRGDNRYAMVASMLIESSDIDTLRQSYDLPSLYSNDRPTRFTFGVVPNELCRISQADLLQRLIECPLIKAL